MTEPILKTCPFKHEKCTSDCALFVDPGELNEVVRNKLASVGVIKREEGVCAFKNMSLSMMRELFERTSGFLR